MNDLYKRGPSIKNAPCDSLHYSGTEQSLLGDFPMAGPAALSTPQRHPRPAGDKDMSQWFSLFAELDPLANPDAVGADTKEQDRNC